jgi:hypothetical protein
MLVCYEIQPAIATAASNKVQIFRQQIGLKLEKKLVKSYTWSIAVCGVETWTLRKVEQKFLESFEMWCWRWTEKISWTDRVSK